MEVPEHEADASDCTSSPCKTLEDFQHCCIHAVHHSHVGSHTIIEKALKNFEKLKKMKPTLKA